MKLLKKQPQKEASSDASLADQIKQARNEAAEFVERKVQELKNSPEGQSLPIEWLRQNLRATTRAGGCSCKAALVLLEKEKHG
jgi:hypothetical protein